MKELRAVTMEEMLEARERRAGRIAVFLHGGGTIISFSMNIPGPIKNSFLIREGFHEGCRRLETALKEDHIFRFREYREDFSTGCEALYVVDGEPISLKRICAEIEDRDELGRLFDMDVITPDGRKIERGEIGLSERGCIVCGAPGRGCASRRLHSADELQRETARRLIAGVGAELTADLACDCLLDEVRVTPKPGLVDAAGSGSHSDMDLSLFERSAAALRPCWESFFTVGRASAQESAEEACLRLRAVGLEAEKTMFSATGGVNTHKGAIFLMGLICGAVGRLWKEFAMPSVSDIFAECKKMTAAAMAAEFDEIKRCGKGDTAGARLYLAYGLRGARGEAADGFPSVSGVSLPALEDALAAGLSENHAAAVALLHLIALGRDTNLYHRGGEEGARWAAKAAKALLTEERFPSLERIAALDRKFIARNLSPGGCADLLTVTLFLSRWDSTEETEE